MQYRNCIKLIIISDNLYIIEINYEIEMRRQILMISVQSVPLNSLTEENTLYFQDIALS